MVLLVAGRLRRRHNLAGALPQQQQQHLLPQPSLLVELPHELWHMVCSFFVRSGPRCSSPAVGGDWPTERGLNRCDESITYHRRMSILIVPSGFVFARELLCS